MRFSPSSITPFLLPKPPFSALLGRVCELRKRSVLAAAGSLPLFRTGVHALSPRCGLDLPFPPTVRTDTLNEASARGLLFWPGLPLVFDSDCFYGRCFDGGGTVLPEDHASSLIPGDTAYFHPFVGLATGPSPCFCIGCRATRRLLPRSYVGVFLGPQLDLTKPRPSLLASFVIILLDDIRIVVLLPSLCRKRVWPGPLKPTLECRHCYESKQIRDERF